MSSKQIRVISRYAHIIVGSMMIAFIYSTSLRESDAYIAMMQFIVVPAVIISGTVMWQLPRINKWRSQRRKQQQLASD